MRSRSVFLYWLLIFVPTVVTGVLLARLLRHEEERLSRTFQTAAESQARLIADQITAAVQDLESGLLAQLKAIPRRRLRLTLEAWEHDNPLVRNVFILGPDGAPCLPDPSQSLTGEQRAFLRRCAVFFQSESAWENPRDDIGAAPANTAAQADTLSVSPQQEFRRSLAKNARLQQGADAATDMSPAEAATANAVLKPSSSSPMRGYGGPLTATGSIGGARPKQPGAGWLPWVSDNRLHLIAWVRPDVAPDGFTAYGVEIEMTALLARLTGALPPKATPGCTYALLDDAGQVVHQRGVEEVTSASRKWTAISLAPVLPHWEVATYGAGPTTGAGRGFALLTGALAALFIVAIVTGATLLLSQARRHMRDAQRKSSFVSNVSHELKTPLTTIRLYAELLSENRVPDEARRRDYLQVIVEESQRLTRLVNNVLDFSRLDQRRKHYRVEPLELSAFLRTVLQAQRRRIEEAGLRLEEALPDTPLTVATDRDALEQAVLNLLDNAAKYAAEGGALRVELVPHPNGGAAIRILDRGPGIPPEHRARLFETFYRVDDTLTARQPGTGLGLSLARRMLRELGGDVRFEPRDGGGAVFIVELPPTEIPK